MAAVLALALALGVIFRHGAGPVTATIAPIVVRYFFTGPMAILHGSAADWILRVTPAAAFAVQQVLPAYPRSATPTHRSTATTRSRRGPGSPSCASGPPPRS